MKFTYLGHSAGYLETGTDKFLFDPFLTGNPKASVQAGQVNPTYILLTHGHSDHVGDSVAISKRTGAPIITTFELANWLAAQEVKTIAMNHGGWCKFPFGRIRFTIAFHSSSVIEDGGRPLYLGEAAGVVLETEGKTIYHAGDTALFSDLRLIGEDAPIDLGAVAYRRAFHDGTEGRCKGSGVFGAKACGTNSLWHFSTAGWRSSRVRQTSQGKRRRDPRASARRGPRVLARIAVLSNVSSLCAWQSHEIIFSRYAG